MSISSKNSHVEKWLDYCSLMESRNKELGLRRYDHGDLLSHSFYSRYYNRLPQALAKSLRIPEVLFPHLWRQLLGVNRTLVPVTLYHLGMYHLICSRIGIDKKTHKDETISYCDNALSISLDSRYLCWEHPYEHHGRSWKDDLSNDDPPSCAHHTARLGYLLAQAGLEIGAPNLIQAGRSAQGALLNYHNWHYYEDGRCTVSYYPNTNDEVINTAAEVASCFASLPREKRSTDVSQRLEGIVRMILSEQRDDGSWFYCTREHYREMGGEPVVDNHHSAMVLHALAKAAGEVDTSSLRNETRLALEKGVRHYLNNFVDDKGRASYFPSSSRKANISGYCEGIIMLTVVLRRADRLGLEDNLVQRMECRMYQLIDVAIETFLDRETGDVASYTVFGVPVHLQSIRLGSGLLMETIIRVIEYART